MTRNGLSQRACRGWDHHVLFLEDRYVAGIKSGAARSAFMRRLRSRQKFPTAIRKRITGGSDETLAAVSVHFVQQRAGGHPEPFGGRRLVAAQVTQRIKDDRSFHL